MSIGDEFTLYGGGGEVCGVNPGPEEGQVLLSFTSGSVQLYNVSSEPLNDRAGSGRWGNIAA